MGEFQAGKGLTYVILYFLIIGTCAYFLNAFFVNIGEGGLGVSDLDALNFTTDETLAECHPPRAFYKPNGEVTETNYLYVKCETMIGSVQEDSCNYFDGCFWDNSTTWTCDLFGWGCDSPATCNGDFNISYYLSGQDLENFKSPCDYPVINSDYDSCVALGCLWYNEGDYDSGISFSDAQTFGDLALNLITLRFDTALPDEIEKPLNVFFIHCVILYGLICIYLLLPFAH